MDKLTAIKIKYDDGTYSDEILVSALAENVKWDSTHTLVDVLGNVDVDVTGTIQDQIDNLDIWKTVYPIGAYYISERSTSPAELFGGTWEKVTGGFLWAADNTHPAGSVGGEETHILTVAEIPSHSHVYSNATGVQGHQLTVNEIPSHTHGIHWVGATPPQGGGGDSQFGVAQNAVGNQQSGATGGNGSHNHGLSKANANTTNAGSGSAHNNMPPYRSVYMWRRIE